MEPATSKAGQTPSGRAVRILAEIDHMDRGRVCNPAGSLRPAFHKFGYAAGSRKESRFASTMSAFSGAADYDGPSHRSAAFSFGVKYFFVLTTIISPAR